jgi:hypothetical protein
VEALKGKRRPRRNYNLTDNFDINASELNCNPSKESVESLSTFGSSESQAPATSIHNMCATLNSLLSTVKQLYTIQSDVSGCLDLVSKVGVYSILLALLVEKT